MSLRRSARKAKVVSYAEMAKESTYPDGPPQTATEKLLHSLNLQAFPILSYGEVDDTLVYSLFATKRRPNSYRQLNPSSISSVRLLTASEGIAIARICHSQISEENPTREACYRVAMQLVRTYPHLFMEHISILEQ
jgi:hypothetical protein